MSRDSANDGASRGNGCHFPLRLDGSRITVVIVAASSAHGAPEGGHVRSVAFLIMSTTIATTIGAAAGEQWQHSESTSEMDGAKSVTLGVAADGPQSLELARRPLLIVSCTAKAGEKGVLLVGVTTGEGIVVSSAHTRARYDDAPAEIAGWTINATKTGFAAPVPDETIKRMRSAGVFRFEFHPVGRPATVARFDVSGLGRRIGPVADLCGL